MTQTMTRIPAGFPVAIAGTMLYFIITGAMAPGALRTLVAIALPALAFTMTMIVLMRRLQQVNSNQKVTRTLFEIAGAALLASPMLGYAVHLQG